MVVLWSAIHQHGTHGRCPDVKDYDDSGVLSSWDGSPRVRDFLSETKDGSGRSCLLLPRASWHIPDTLGRKPNAPKLGGKIMLWPRKYVTMVFCGVLKSGLAIQSTHFCVDLLSSERVHCIGKTEKAACCALADWFPRVGHGADKAQSDRCSQPLQQWRDAPERLSSWGIPTGVEATATCTTIVRFSDETTLLSAFLLGMWS